MAYLVHNSQADNPAVISTRGYIVVPTITTTSGAPAVPTVGQIWPRGNT